MTDPKLTIVCIAYNQEKYIAQALDGFIMQKTNFPFEVIISDDCSTDGTPDIINEYAKKYPEIIKPIFRGKNLGVVENYISTLSEAKSEYLIVNEGDDYFTDPLKLQRQVDFLDKNPDFSICFHPVRFFFEDGSKEDEIFPSKKYRFDKKVLDLKDLLKHNFIQTNSCVYRWRFGDKEKLEDVFPKDILPCDYFLHLLHAQKGKMGFIDKVMADYRKHPAGIWYDCYRNMDNLILKNGIKMLKFYSEVNKTIAPSDFNYHEKMLVPAARHIFSIYLKNGCSSEFAEVSKQVPEITYLDTYNKLNILEEKIGVQEEYFGKKIKKFRRIIRILALICTFLVLGVFGFTLYHFALGTGL